MKRLAIAATCAILVFGTAAQAQQGQPVKKSPFYAELGYTFLKFDDGLGDSTRPGAVRLLAGYDIHPYFGVEGLAAWGVSKSDTTVVAAGVPVRVEYDVSHIYGIYFKPRYNYENWEFFGRVGWANTRIKATASAGGFTGSASASDNDFSYGVGVNYQINPKWYTGIDYMMYNDNGGGKVSGINLAVGYRF
jgi:opacity protein-like surface antigen